jgi:hypothetical protein
MRSMPVPYVSTQVECVTFSQGVSLIG